MQAAVQAHDGEIASAGITTVLDAIGVGDPYDDGFRSRDQSELLRVLDRLDAAGALRVDHHVHVRAELPAPNALELFEPFRAHRRLRLISLMDHTPGQRQWTQVEHARVYYTGKKGWSNEKFDQEMRLAPQRQAKFAAPHRQWFADFARTHGVALATHDDVAEDDLVRQHEPGVGEDDVVHGVRGMWFSRVRRSGSRRRRALLRHGRCRRPPRRAPWPRR